MGVQYDKDLQSNNFGIPGGMAIGAGANAGGQSIQNFDPELFKQFMAFHQAQPQQAQPQQVQPSTPTPQVQAQQSQQQSQMFNNPIVNDGQAYGMNNSGQSAQNYNNGFGQAQQINQNNGLNTTSVTNTENNGFIPNADDSVGGTAEDNLAKSNRPIGDILRELTDKYGKANEEITKFKELLIKKAKISSDRYVDFPDLRVYLNSLIVSGSLEEWLNKEKLKSNGLIDPSTGAYKYRISW